MSVSRGFAITDSTCWQVVVALKIACYLVNVTLSLRQDYSHLAVLICSVQQTDPWRAA